MPAVTGFAELPESAVWRHGWSREGFEVAYLQQGVDGITMTGTSLGVEDGKPWAVDYVIELDPAWVTRRAVVTARAGTLQRSVALHSAGPGAWLIDGRPAPGLNGCYDVDMDVSALTNAIPLHRLRLDLKDTSGDLDALATPAPAVYIQATDLRVSRLDQTYRRRAGTSSLVFDYRAPAFDFRTDIAYDHAGLVRDYPGIAVRVR
jgi:uncharacterized protein